MINQEWLTTGEAAQMLGYSRDYFRRSFCDKKAPKVPIRVRKGPKGGIRILVLRRAIEKLAQDEVSIPA